MILLGCYGSFIRTHGIGHWLLLYNLMEGEGNALVEDTWASFMEMDYEMWWSPVRLQIIALIAWNIIRLIVSNHFNDLIKQHDLFGMDFLQQVRMAQLMVKEVSGGTCGDREISSLQDQILLNLWIPEALLFPMWFLKIHLFGTFTLFIAGNAIIWNIQIVATLLAVVF